MANFVGKYAKPAFPVGSYAGGRVLQAAIGTYVAPAGVATNDTFEMCKVPTGAQVLKREVYVDGVLVAAPVIGFVGAPTALSLVEGPVVAPTPDLNLTNGNGADAVVVYTVSATEAVAAGDDIYVIVYYLYAQPTPV